ncbi:MAG: excinuclease ABC subunit C, partial [Parcubacteria group bacterium Gr01-1014_48]
MNRQDFAQLKLPDSPGVYMFTSSNRAILYIGKATSLRNRVRSYFSTDIATTRGPKVLAMIAEAAGLRHIPTDSVLEALILEGNLIRKHQPIYNTDRKDDKSYNHVIITKEDYPRVLLLRGKDLAQMSKDNIVKGLSLKDLRYIFGPYPHGTALKQALKLVRKIFPYRDTCTPHHFQILKSTVNYKTPKSTPPLLCKGGSSHPPCHLYKGGNSGSSSLYEREGGRDFIQFHNSEKHTTKAHGCFNFEINLCPGVCTGSISKKEYGKRIQHIKLFFEGKKSKILKDLVRDMKTYAQNRQFEKAAQTRNALFSLEHIQDVSLLSRENMQESFEPRG